MQLKNKFITKSILVFILTITLTGCEDEDKIDNSNETTEQKGACLLRAVDGYECADSTTSSECRDFWSKSQDIFTSWTWYPSRKCSDVM